MSDTQGQKPVSESKSKQSNKRNAPRSASQGQRYAYLSTPMTLTFRHQEARRIIAGNELTRVTRAIYMTETSLIPQVGAERIEELIEAYERRGEAVIEALRAEKEKLEEMLEEIEISSAEEAIESMIPADNQTDSITYNRSAGGQNKFLKMLSEFDTVCCLAQLCAVNSLISPVQRYKIIDETRSQVLEYIKIVKRQNRRAQSMAAERREQQEAQRNKNKQSDDSTNQEEDAATGAADSELGAGDEDDPSTDFHHTQTPYGNSKAAASGDAPTEGTPEASSDAESWTMPAIDAETDAAAEAKVGKA